VLRVSCIMGDNGTGGRVVISNYHSSRKVDNAMAFIPVPETVCAEIRMQLDGQRIENTLYFQQDGGWSQEEGVSLANDLLLWWTNSFRVPLSQDVSLREIYLTDLSSATSWTHTQPAPAPAPTGSQNLPAAPNNVALCFSFRTAARGRSFRGRNFVSGYPRDNITSNDLASAQIADTLEAYNALFPMMDAWDGRWVVASRYSNKLPRPIGVTTRVTSVVVVDPTVDSQRRRLPGRGM